MISKRHAVMMHGIAQLAFFYYGLLVGRSLMRLVSVGPYHVLVSKYHYLPGRKKCQDYPGVNDMLLTFFQNSIKYHNNSAFPQK
jgi:hypothetical protein